MDSSETPSTAQHRSSFEEIFTPINKITQALGTKELKIIGNEALTLYTKLETDKLQMHARELNKTCIKLEEQTEQILKHQKELAASNEESRKSLALQSKTLLILQTQYESFKTKIDEECNSYKTTYKEYAEKYKKAECVYETHHPRYKHLKELEIESRKKEIEYRMLKQKIAEEKKRIALRYEIQRKMFHCSIVKFVQAVVTYWKARDLSVQLKEAEKRELQLIQQLQDLELLVAKKERARQLAEKNAAATKPSPTPQFKLPVVKFPPPPASTASYPISSFTKYTPTNSQETLLYMRNKLEQRKQEWSQRRSFSSSLSNKRPYSTDNSIDQKRRSLQMNTPAQNKIFNCPKVNIVDVKTFKPLKPGNIKENLMAPKIGTSQQMMSSQSHTEENNRSLQRPLVNITNHSSERMLQMQPQLHDITKTVPTAFSVDKIVSQDISRYPSQASQNFFPLSRSQQSNISLPSAIKQTSSQEMMVQFSQASGNGNNISSQPQTQEENTMLTSITNKNIPQTMSHTLPALQEQNIFSLPENNRSLQRPLVNITTHSSERMLQMQPQLHDITKIVPTTAFSVDKIVSQDISRYPSQASQNFFPLSRSQQSNISLPSAIKQTSSQEMMVQFSQASGNGNNISSQPQTQEENTMLTSITNKNIPQTMSHTLPALQEQNIFSLPENNRSLQRPLVNITTHSSERMLQMQPQLHDITKIVPTTAFSVDKIVSQDISRYPSQASQNFFPLSRSQQSNISLPSAIKQTSSQEMMVQFSQASGNGNNISSQPQTQEENTMLTSITNKNIPQTMPQTLPALQEQNIFSSPQSQDNRSSLNENKFAIPKTSTAQLQYRSQIAPSQSQAGASLQDNTQTQGTATESCEFSNCDVTQNLNHMQLTENQPEQNKGLDDCSRISQSSTFSQKCQQLSEILAKEIPEMECEVTSVPVTNPSTTAVITSPFFNKTKTMDTVEAGDNNTMQAPLQIRKDTMFAGKSIEELLDNSALFHDQEMPTESSFIEENQPLFSPDYSMNAEPDLNLQPGQSSAFSFNFQQPPSAQPNETKSFFSTTSGLFNMFS